ncbi:hypothetical protein MTYM_00371 [Methylococcales bacterium]|nr:hypothetical protein MTYM_00371 [Methylococcales bacterium]
MRSKKSGILAIAIATVLSFGTFCQVSYGEAQPASKATANVGDIHIIDATNLGWTTILQQSLHTANQKSLFVDVSLECGLYTDTLVKSKGDTSDTSSASATIEVKVLIDGNEAHPGVVTFANREQTLTAKLQGMLTSDCLTDGVLNITDDCLLYEEIQLLLKTMNANSFNFVTDTMDAGNHVIEVQARISTDASYQNGNAAAMATIGKGSVAIEEVRLIKGEDIEI